MLDNERTRWVSAALFFSFGYQLFLMVMHPLDTGRLQLSQYKNVIVPIKLTYQRGAIL